MFSITTKTNIRDGEYNTWCRDTRALFVKRFLKRNPFTEFRGCRLRKCPFGDDCRGAHHIKELKILPNIKEWSIIDKSSFDFVKYFIIMKDVIKSNTIKLSIKEKEITMEIDTMNFFQVLNFWQSLAFKYGKIKKNLFSSRKYHGKKTNTFHDFKFREDVPIFTFENEDYMWALQRMISMCHQQKSFIDKIEKKEKVTIRDICCGDFNCKFGVHHIDEMICMEDFLTGTCSCFETGDEKKQHYCRDGMVPFNIQYRAYIEAKAMKEKEEIEKLNELKTRSGVKKVRKIRKLKKLIKLVRK